MDAIKFIQKKEHEVENLFKDWHIEKLAAEMEEFAKQYHAEQLRLGAVVGRREQLCQHDRSVINRICNDCGSVITYVPDDELA